MKILVVLVFEESASISFIFLTRSGFLTGMYPIKWKDCPFKPEPIKAKVIEDGPTNGACYCRLWEARAASDRYQSKIPATIAREKRVRHSGDFKFSRSCFDDINPASTSIEGMSGAFSTEKFACRMGREFTRLFPAVLVCQ